MAYNNVISRTDAAALVPEDVSAEVLKAVPEQSTVMRLARKLPNMSRAQRRLPLMSVLPSAYFVSGDISRKQTTEINWANRYIDAEELAVIVPIPEAVLDDVNYDIWGEVKPALVEALGIAIDQAVLYGTNIPSSWSTNLGEAATPRAGLLARCTAASHTISLAAYTDMYEALLGKSAGGAAGLCGLIEQDGYMSSGCVCHLTVRAELRNTRDTLGQPIFRMVTGLDGKARFEMDGNECLFPRNGAIDSAESLVICGDWNQLLFAMRQDITYKVLDQAVITDAQGAILYNLAQQDMVALRCVMRCGFALPNPINRVNSTELTRCPFAILTA